MSTRVYLIRHGATVLSAEDRFAGATNVELSEEGIAQVRALAARLSVEHVDAVYSSPLKRTLDTARIIAEPHSVHVSSDDRLREISHGRWEGLTRAEVEARFEGEYAKWEEDPFTFAPESGESGVAAMARALPAIRDLVTRSQGKCIAIISHKATIRLILCGLLGIDARGYRDRLDQSPASLNVLEFKDVVRARLMTYNDTSHYTVSPRRPEGLSKWWPAKA
ncbi:MAG: histidine phosphatase family protein [Sandaracinaceae bacterium]|nr:histidine phosphatase family protein [Sandaracinaceae bacterium]